MQEDTGQEQVSANQVKWWPFPLALVIASVPVIGYLFAYSYEAGYASVFGIPPGLIELSNLDVIKIWVPVAGLVVTTIGMGPFMLLFMPVKAIPLAIRLVPWYFLIGAWATFLIVTSAGWRSWLILTVVVAVLLVVELFYFIRSKKQNEMPKTRSPIVMDRLFSGVKAAYIWTPFVLIGLMVGVFLMGLSYAKEKPDFIVLEEPTPQVVLRIYNDLVIAAPIVGGPDGRFYIGDEFTVYRLDTLSGHRLKYLRVGPLIIGSPK